MHRILNPEKDTYITNVITEGRRRDASNVGQAGTLDLFKKVNVSNLSSGQEFYVSGTSIFGTQVTGSTIEDSSILIKFSFDEIDNISDVDISDPNFKCFLSLKDVYGGQTTPSNFYLKVFPLSKSFDEGRGSDVYGFLDKDTANYLSASSSPGSSWEIPGAYISGSNGQQVDILTDVTASQFFSRGDEDLYVDVTSIVSSTLAGDIENHGFKIQFGNEELQNDKTYFVKRFGSRHVNNRSFKPSLILQNTSRIQDDTGDLYFNQSQNMFVYNRVNSLLTNFIDDSSEITGSNSLILELAASRSIQFTTSSFSISHDMVITHLTKSVDYFSVFITGSQYQINNNPKTGIYFANIFLDKNDQELKDFLSGSQEQTFKATWKTLDESKVLSTYPVVFKTNFGANYNNNVRNTIVNITNLKNIYKNTEKATLRIFAADLGFALPTSKSPANLPSKILRDLRWSIKKPFKGEEVIPFSEATKTSYDFEGMYFDIFMSDFDRGEVYEIELLITEENNKTTLIQNQGFRFRVQ